MKKITIAALSALVLVGCVDSPVGLAPEGALEKRMGTMSSGEPIAYTGQGTEIVEGVRVLQTEVCGMENGAEVDGPYILWILTANGPESATISGPWGTEPMVNSGGNFKYVSNYYDPATLVNEVSATYTGEVRGQVQLVIGQGCAGGTEIAAWCGPGYWRNAQDASWDHFTYSKVTLFNSSVYDDWFGAEVEANVTLIDVLSAQGGTYKGSPVPGTLGHELNAFNAVAAMLTEALPGYYFDFGLVTEDDDETFCPLDNHGDWK
jgi:hypothetical protein